MNKDELLEAIGKEFDSSNEKFPMFRSCHEGYAVIREEVDELWDAVKKSKSSAACTHEMRDECIQIAAMCIKFIFSLSLPKAKLVKIDSGDNSQ